MAEATSDRVRSKSEEKSVFMQRDGLSVKLKDSEECLLRHLDATDLFHALLTFLLFLKEFALTRYVTAVTFGSHVLADSLDGLTRNYLGSNRSLDSDVKLLTRDELLQFFAHAAAECDRVVDMGQCRQCVDTLAVEQDVELDKL